MLSFQNRGFDDLIQNVSKHMLILCPSVTTSLIMK